MLNEKQLEIVKLGVDHINHVAVTNFSDADRNTAIKNKFLELMGTDKFDPQSFNTYRPQIFQIIKETLQQTIANGEAYEDAFYQQFVEEKNIAWGDSQEFEIENDAYLTVGEVSGNNWNMDRQRMDKGSIYTVKTKYFYIKIYDYFKRFMTGRMDWAELASKVDKAIAKHKKEFVAQVFQSAISGLPANFQYSGAYDQNEIQNVLSHVEASNEGQITLVGTKGALNKLQTISDVTISNNMKEELNSLGYLRVWKGYNCVELPTAFKANSIDEFIFDNETIYVLASDVKPIKIVNEGDIIVQEVGDISTNQDMTKEFAVLWGMGGCAIFNRLFGCIKLV